MYLTEHKPGDHHYIRKVGQDGVVIGDEAYQTSLILGARLLQTPWPVSDLASLSVDKMAALLKHQPELIILGIGDQQQFPSTEIYAACFKQQVGLECMTLESACRTFNILMSENRRALLGLIFPAT